jgi:L-lysine exporter family protein LysE/ArgO
MPFAVMLQGLGLGLSLILPIGAQNAFVLRQGLRRQHVWAVVAVCAASDVVLITLGVSGAGAVFTRFPDWLTFAKWAGAVFLIAYAVFAARRALRPGVLVVDRDAAAESGTSAMTPSQAGRGAAVVGGGGGEGGRATSERVATATSTNSVASATSTRRVWPVLMTALALTWLNPHVYLDTLVLLGSLASTHGSQAWAFGVGASVASVVWFSVLGAGSRLLSPLFAKPIAWRIVDGSIAVVMTVIAVNLLLH